MRLLRVACVLCALSLRAASPASAVEVWREDFKDPALEGKGAIGPGPTVDLAGVTRWTIDVSQASMTTNQSWFRVVGQRLEGQNLRSGTTGAGPAVWLSETIPIAAWPRVSFSLTATESGGLEDADYYDVAYSLDGGSFVTVTNWLGLGTNTHTLVGNRPTASDWGATVVAVSNLVGATLRLRVAMRNSANDERMHLDDVLVTAPSAVTITNPPASRDVANGVTNYVVAGESYGRAGALTWTNAPGWGGAVPAAAAWSANVPLRVGDNRIVVSGADSLGAVAAATVTIRRLAAPYAGALRQGAASVVGYRSNAPDSVALVAWTNIAAGTVLRLTDNGWKGAGGLRATEDTISWTAPAGGVAAGTVVVFTFAGGASNTVSAGTLAGGLNQLSTDGDQVLVYTNTAAVPAFLTGFDFSGTAGWDADAVDGQTSALPPDLAVTNGSLAVTHFDNGRYAGPRIGTLAILQDAVHDPANWDLQNTDTRPLSNETFTILAPAAPSPFLINEVCINPPGTNDSRECVELIAAGGGAAPLTGAWLLVLDSAGGAVGEVREAWNLDGLATGANGLLLLGNHYGDTPPGGPWAAQKAVATQAAEPNGPGDTGWANGDVADDQDFTLLLVASFTGTPGQDLDTDDDLVLDVRPWDVLLDSVGFGQTYAGAALNPGFTPDVAARLTGNLAGNSAAAWCAADMAASGDPLSTAFEAVNRFRVPARGQFTPGTPNYPLPGDQDSDGLPDWWERFWYRSATAAADGADDDRDGRTNLQEYQADSNPTNSASAFAAVTNLVAAGAGWQLPVPHSSTGRLYDVWWKSNLLDASWQRQWRLTPGNGGTLYLSVTNAAPRRFFRVSVRAP